LIRDYNKNGRILDYGAGTGEFLASMKRRGYTVSGIEPDPVARQRALEKNRIKLSDPNELEALAGNEQFDIITMWHVLEHIHDPKALINTLGERLSQNGTLIIAVPNYLSKDAETYASDWAAYDVPRHLFHFTRSTISELAQHCGLGLKKVLPMYFDAYYVSMLSEKNNGAGSAGLVKGVLSGLRSNLTARFKTGEYSSLIYVLKNIKP